MLGRPHRSHPDSLRSAGNSAATTAKALIGVDNRLVFLAALRTLHLNGIKKATFYAYLAAIAVIEIDTGLVSAFLPA